MNRRAIVALLAGALALTQAASAQPATNFYTLDIYTLEGAQYSRLNNHLRDAYLPALARIHLGPVLILEDTAEDVPPQMAVLTGYQSIGQMLKVRVSLDQELAGCRFRDPRLGRRFRKFVGQLARKLGQTIPLACQD